MKPQDILIRDYTYELPPQRIAELPLAQRDASQLLHYRNGQIADGGFTDLPQLLPAGATMIFNDTRVIEARLLFQKPTGGVIEIFCLEPATPGIEAAMQQTGRAVWKCMIGGASKWKQGQVLSIQHDDTTLLARYAGKEPDAFLIEFEWSPANRFFAEVLHAVGAIPLPPYIKRKAGALDKERYQTVFSKHEGSVAAPTAALHFTPEVLAALQANAVDTGYITLHVGAGTFKPVKAARIADHEMHGEPFVVKKDLLEKLLHSHTIVAVGTTSMRTLESLFWLGLKLHYQPNTQLELNQWEAYEWEEKATTVDYRQSLQWLLQWMNERAITALHCRTSIIIVPGYRFRMVAALVTNFHQPQSTLLLLIAAFVGDDWRKIYEHALANNYRFLSYGDSSLLWRKDG